jgi:hypothetical protein
MSASLTLSAPSPSHLKFAQNAKGSADSEGVFRARDRASEDQAKKGQDSHIAFV